jgi:hypothetical protein
LEIADHTTARAKLTQARSIVRKKREALTRILDDQRREEANLVFEQGRVESARLAYEQAAQLFAEAAGLLTTSDPARWRYFMAEAGAEFAWQCEQKDDALACQEGGRLNKIAILVAQAVDPLRDNIAVYASVLEQRREWRTGKGKIIISSDIRSGSRCYDGTLWQWGHHYQSELENHYTEYFARIERGVAILFTLTFHFGETDGSTMAAAIARRLNMISSSSAPSAAEC